MYYDVFDSKRIQVALNFILVLHSYTFRKIKVSRLKIKLKLGEKIQSYITGMNVAHNLECTPASQTVFALRREETLQVHEDVYVCFFTHCIYC